MSEKPFRRGFFFSAPSLPSIIVVVAAVVAILVVVAAVVFETVIIPMLNASRSVSEAQNHTRTPPHLSVIHVWVSLPPTAALIAEGIFARISVVADSSHALWEPIAILHGRIVPIGVKKERKSFEPRHIVSSDP